MFANQIYNLHTCNYKHNVLQLGTTLRVAGYHAVFY